MGSFLGVVRFELRSFVAGFRPRATRPFDWPALSLPRDSGQGFFLVKGAGQGVSNNQAGWKSLLFHHRKGKVTTDFLC